MVLIQTNQNLNHFTNFSWRKSRIIGGGNKLLLPSEPFESFQKIPRLNRECIVSEKIDGTNGVIYIRAPCVNCNNEFRAVEEVDPVGTPILVESCCTNPKISDKSNWTVHAGSKNKWITPEMDNHGFAAWVESHLEELKELGPGKHHGEWFGPGIQTRYSKFMKEKQFTLFNVSRWRPAINRLGWEDKIQNSKVPPACCTVVPILYIGPFNTEQINKIREELRTKGSVMVPESKAEGVIVYHIPSGLFFKATVDKDEEWKGRGGK